MRGLKKFQVIQSKGGPKSLRIQRGGYNKFSPIFNKFYMKILNVVRARPHLTILTNLIQKLRLFMLGKITRGRHCVFLTVKENC